MHGWEILRGELGRGVGWGGVNEKLRVLGSSREWLGVYGVIWVPGGMLML